MFSLVQHLLYQVDPMADSYEMNHMVVNTTAETVWYQKASRAIPSKNGLLVASLQQPCLQGCLNHVTRLFKPCKQACFWLVTIKYLKLFQPCYNLLLSCCEPKQGC